MNIIFVVLLSVLTISNSEFLLGSRSNSSLITVAEFRELVDLISEEKQLRHALEHNVATLQQKLTSNEAAYKQLQNDYRNLTTAYNSLKVSNDDLQRQFVDMKSTNQSIQRFLTSNTADLSNLKRKAGKFVSLCQLIQNTFLNYWVIVDRILLFHSVVNHFQSTPNEALLN